MEWYGYILIPLIIVVGAVPFVVRSKREQKKDSAPSSRGPAGSSGRG